MDFFSFFITIKKKKPEVPLICNVVLVSDEKHSDPVIHLSILFHILFNYSLLWDSEYSSLCYYNRSCLFLYIVLHACLLSRVQLFATPWTVACQGPLSMGFSRQEYWSGLPLPPPGISLDLPDPGIDPACPVSCIGRRTLYHCCGVYMLISNS